MSIVEQFVIELAGMIYAHPLQIKEENSADIFLNLYGILNYVDFLPNFKRQTPKFQCFIEI